MREGGWPKVKVGHGGTLDPLAEGVLPSALGEATKLAGRMLEARKRYAFTHARSVRRPIRSTPKAQGGRDLARTGPFSPG